MISNTAGLLQPTVLVLCVVCFSNKIGSYLLEYSHSVYEVDRRAYTVVLVGNRITPSYVAFSGESGERLIGDAAKNQLTINPENTVFDAKRLIGRNFNDKTVQDDIKLWPFKVR